MFEQASHVAELALAVITVTLLGKRAIDSLKNGVLIPIEGLAILSGHVVLGTLSASNMHVTMPFSASLCIPKFVRSIGFALFTSTILDHR